MKNSEKLSLFRKKSSKSKGFHDVESFVDLNLFNIFNLHNQNDIITRAQQQCSCKDGCCPSNNQQAAFGDYLKNTLSASNNSKDTTDTLILA